MAGPTTEILNEDIKEVKADLHEIRIDVGVVRAGLQHVNEDIKELKGEIRDTRGDVAVIKTDLHNVGIGLAELRGEFRSSDLQKVATGLADLQGEFRVIKGIAKWAGAFLVSTGVAGVWWASGISSKVDGLNIKMDEKFKELDARFTRLEASIAKMVEQGRQAEPVPKVGGMINPSLK